MCLFITAVLPASASYARLDRIAIEYDRQFDPLHNESMEKQLLRSERYFLTTPGHCDCGTSLGALKWAAYRAKQDSSANTDRMADPVCWKEFISAVLLSGGTEQLGLLLHSYNGSLHDSIKLQGRETILLSQVSDDWLGHMKEDVLYTIRLDTQ